MKELSLEYDIPPKQLIKIWQRARQKLFKSRAKRVHPFKDDKVLTDWNGLMIAALAKGAQVLDSVMLSKAANATSFILGNLKNAEGKLLHRYREKEASVDGNLDDYAFLIWGLIELYEATFRTKYLDEALRLEPDEFTMYVTSPSTKDKSWADEYPNKSVLEIIMLAPWHWFEPFSSFFDKQTRSHGPEYETVKDAFAEKMWSRVSAATL